MEKQIIYTENYITIDQVDHIKKYYEDIGDSLLASRGPYKHSKHKIGWSGCWDRQLHYENTDCPMFNIIDKLQKDFGNFEIYSSSIRYLSSPFLPHSDIETLDWVSKNRHRTEGFTFLIPLSWKKDYRPGTAFFNSPAKFNEPHYSDFPDILPKYSDNFIDETKNFSVRKIFEWKSPGDLIAWENYQFHCSCDFSNTVYDFDSWTKEFISIKVWKI